MLRTMRLSTFSGQLRANSSTTTHLAASFAADGDTPSSPHLAKVPASDDRRSWETSGLSKYGAIATVYQLVLDGRTNNDKLASSKPMLFVHCNC